MPDLPLTPGQSYSWDDMGGLFGFRPGYLSAAGGMPVSTATDSVLLITHPGGGKAFDYADYWDDGDLIYTGRGQVGNQKRTGPNLDVAENRRSLLVFESTEPKVLRFIGKARCVGETIGRAPDKHGVIRDVLLFRLRFASANAQSHATPVEIPSTKKMPAPPQQPDDRRADAERREREFNPAARPARAGALRSPAADPALTSALREKAQQGHHDLVAAWAAHLGNAGWSACREIPGGFDLMSRTPHGQRVIFEMKTVSRGNELGQCRSGLAQLLEYRLEYGIPDDWLCLITSSPISSARAELLDALGIGVISRDGDSWVAANAKGAEIAYTPGQTPSAHDQFLAAQARLGATRESLAGKQAAEVGQPKI